MPHAFLPGCSSSVSLISMRKLSSAERGLNLRLAARSFFIILISACPAAGEQPSHADVLAGVKSFFHKTARADGSFRPGIDPAYEGMSDSAYSDLAPTAYAVIVHKTFAWPLPHAQQTL